MGYLIELLINGLSTGAVYGLVALGFVVVFRATDVVNFAYGAFVLLGAYVVGRLAQAGVPFPVAAVAGLLATGLAGVAMDRLVLRPARGSAAMLGILTLGVDVIVVTEITRRLGVDILTTGDPWGTATVSLAGATIPVTRLVALAVCVVILGAFFTAMRLTAWGVAMRAVADDPRTARLMGIRVDRVSSSAWALAGLFALVAALALAAFPSPGIEASLRLSAFLALPGAIIGGLDSPHGAVIGGVLVGMTASLVAGYQHLVPFLGRDIAAITPFLLMILVLLVRPSGLFGSREVARV